MAETISIERARQKLGERGKRMTDQQISDLLTMLRALCSRSIDSVIEKNHTKKAYEN